MTAEQQKSLERELTKPIVFQNPHHPAGRSTLILNQPERDEVIRRVEKVMNER